MTILFADRDLERLCSEEREARRRFGAEGARKLRARLADLRAATRVRDLLAGRPHPLRHDRSGQFAVDLHGGRRLVFAPAHEPVPLDPTGAVDWTQVTTVCIVFIGDYHD